MVYAPKYLYKLIPFKINTYDTRLHIQLVHTFVEQMPSNAPFSLTQFENGTN